MFQYESEKYKIIRVGKHIKYFLDLFRIAKNQDLLIEHVKVSSPFPKIPLKFPSINLKKLRRNMS